MTTKDEDRDATEERYEGDTQERSWDANVKRTYDEYQDLSLRTSREHQALFDKILTDSLQNDNVRQNIANQSLQNAVESANMVSKQAVRHGDLAIDRQWNVDEVALIAAGAAVAAVRAMQKESD